MATRIVGYPIKLPVSGIKITLDPGTEAPDYLRSRDYTFTPDYSNLKPLSIPGKKPDIGETDGD